jgi:hypothetical protein
MPPKPKDDDKITKGELRRAEVAPPWVPVAVVPSPEAPPPQVQSVTPPDAPVNWDAMLPERLAPRSLRRWVRRGRARGKIQAL